MTASRWIVSRLLPCAMIILLGSLASGVFRALTLFIPGITGMIAGGVLGWLTGSLGRGDPEIAWSFTNRVWLALGAGLLWAIANVSVVSILNAGIFGLPFDWLSEVASGFEDELFIGFSTNSYQATGGGISGFWWFLFVIIDGLLFAFLFLVTTMVGWGGGREEDGEPATPPPLHPERGLVPLPVVSFGMLATLSLGTLLLLSMWPIFGSPAGAGSSADQLIAELEGNWVFGEEASFIGDTREARSFRLVRGLGTELAGFSTAPATFALSLRPRRDGVFDCHLTMPVIGMRQVRMQPSEDRNELVLLIDIWTPNGKIEKRILAHRVGSHGP